MVRAELSVPGMVMEVLTPESGRVFTIATACVHDAHLVVRLRVLLVEKSSPDHDDVANLLVLWIYAHDLQIALFPAAHSHSFVEREHGRRIRDSADLVLYGLH